MDETRKSGEKVRQGFAVMKHAHKRPITLSNYPLLSISSSDGNNTFLLELAFTHSHSILWQRDVCHAPGSLLNDS